MSPIKQCILGVVFGAFIAFGTMFAVQAIDREKPKEKAHFNEAHWKAQHMARVAAEREAAEEIRVEKEERETLRKLGKWLEAHSK